MEVSLPEAKYAKNLFQQNRYSVFDNHVTLKETAYNNEVGINTKVLRGIGNSGVVQGIVRWTARGTTRVRSSRRVVFSLRNLFIFFGLKESFLFIRDEEEQG